MSKRLRVAQIGIEHDHGLSTLESLKKLTDDNEPYLASVNRQSWDSFIAVLDSIVRVMDKTSVSTDEFYETMLIAVDAVHIASIPQMLDEVTFGSAERIRPSNISKIS